ncbi:MAG: Flp pilus assembly protein CpaB [Thermoguttaceae bacterium]|jgi:pilus assembly protein CpaB
MRGKSIALLVLALGCGLIASVGITQIVARRSAEKAGPAVEKQPIYVAVQDIALGTKLTPELVKLEDWEKDKVPIGALVRAEDVEGRGTRTRLYAGEPILEQKLFGRGLGERSDDLIPKGYRVVSVRVEPVTIHHGLIQPGTRVDLQVLLRRDPGIGVADTTTKTILQDIRVFAVNDIYSLDTTGHEGKSIQATTVSLLVTPAQAEKVTLASEIGLIRLIMRGPEDDKEVATTGAMPQELFGVLDATHRDKEALVPEGARDLDGPGKGFKEYFNSVQQKMAAKSEAAAPPREAARWTMRLLRGPEINDVEFQEAEVGEGAASADSAWKATGLSVSSAKGGRGQPGATPNPAAQGSPADKKAMEPAKAGSPAEKSKDGPPAADSPKPA